MCPNTLSFPPRFLGLFGQAPKCFSCQIHKPIFSRILNDVLLAWTVDFHYYTPGCSIHATKGSLSGFVWLTCIVKVAKFGCKGPVLTENLLQQTKFPLYTLLACHDNILHTGTHFCDCLCGMFESIGYWALYTASVILSPPSGRLMCFGMGSKITAAAQNCRFSWLSMQNVLTRTSCSFGILLTYMFVRSEIRTSLLVPYSAERGIVLDLAVNRDPTVGPTVKTAMPKPYSLFSCEEVCYIRTTTNVCLSRIVNSRLRTTACMFTSMYWCFVHSVGGSPPWLGRPEVKKDGGHHVELPEPPHLFVV